MTPAGVLTTLVQFTGTTGAAPGTNPQGTLVQFIPIPEDFITNNAFGGSDMRTLYVTAGKTLYRVRTDVPGLPR